ncbi:Fic family protein [Sporanaerobacter acetigenes]|uniref:Fic family protein n=1 Tax=Sporanaerobacter acetigenes DSM 13106 TaxID=1123281 RepID=A0A1M5WF08_9FIRM|nr:Fic family protein [Sporanaerobacter acetigenes]SHH85813.1 Fic family protein [Sporanaerobacter acetigenes DSM 13106]
MDYFYKMYYNIGSIEDRNKIAINRYNYDSAIKTGLKIKPIDQPKIFELFYVPTNNTINLIEKVMSYDKELDEKFDILPGVAKKKFMIEIIADELYSTNELEGVKSSRKEIAESTKFIMSNKKPKNKRFHSMIASYLELINENLEYPKSAGDYRKIYDNITSGEIKEGEIPDGKIFRKDINYVYKNGKQIHRGVYPESSIIEKIEDLIKFMNKKDDELNYLLRIAIGHCYFGYIHPFYDGNGRTGRFISSLYLREKFSLMTTLLLSRGCNINRTEYLRIFDVTNKIVSSGELNYFVDKFLETIIAGQEDLLTRLNEKIYLLDMAYEKIQNDENIETEEELDVMFALIQDHYFSLDSKGMTVKDMVEVLQNSTVTVRKKLKAMEGKGLIKRIKSNPLVYILPDEYLENE